MTLDANQRKTAQKWQTLQIISLLGLQCTNRKWFLRQARCQIVKCKQATLEHLGCMSLHNAGKHFELLELALLRIAQFAPHQSNCDRENDQGQYDATGEYAATGQTQGQTLWA